MPKIKTNKEFFENFNSHILMTFKYLYTFTALLLPFFILTEIYHECFIKDASNRSTLCQKEKEEGKKGYFSLITNNFSAFHKSKHMIIYQIGT